MSDVTLDVEIGTALLEGHAASADTATQEILTRYYTLLWRVSMKIRGDDALIAELKQYMKDTRDVRPHKAGWAPGTTKHDACCLCDESFVGHERAVACADCAYGTACVITTV